MISASLLLADTDKGKASPIGLFVVLVLVVAVYFLYRSMNKQLKKVPESFDPPRPDATDPAAPGQPLSDQTSETVEGSEPSGRPSDLP